MWAVAHFQFTPDRPTGFVRLSSVISDASCFPSANEDWTEAAAGDPKRGSAGEALNYPLSAYGLSVSQRLADARFSNCNAVRPAWRDADSERSPGRRNMMRPYSSFGGSGSLLQKQTLRRWGNPELISAEESGERTDQLNGRTKDICSSVGKRKPECNNRSVESGTIAPFRW